MAIDFSSLGATPAHTGKIDFSSIGGIPAVGQDEPTDDTTALGAAGRGAVGMLPLGNQAYSAVAGAAEKKPYLQERQELEKEIKSDIENHEPSRLAGQAAGIVAPALVTGGASVPESLAEAAGQGAAVGAGFGAGNAIDTLASGGSGTKAAGDVALGAVLGGVGGAAGQKLAGLANKAVPLLEETAARKAAQGVGLGSDELGNMSQQELIGTGKMLMDKSIVRPGASTQEMFDTAKGLHENYGEKIGRIGNEATELGLTTDTKPLLDTLGEKYNAAEQLQNPDERKAALWYKRGMADILAMAKQNGAERVGPDIVEAQTPPSFLTFDQLQKLKKSYGNSAFENGAVKNSAAADVYGQLSAGQKSIVNKASKNPNLPTDLKDAMAGYSKLYPVVNGLQDVLGRERAGNLPAKGFGMMGKLVGQLPGQQNPSINALTSLGLLGAGHPMWAMGAATATLQNPRAMSSLAQETANAIPGIAEKIPGATAQIAGSTPVSQNMGETKPIHASPTVPAPKGPNALNVNHPALAPWKATFDKNAANAKDAGEIQKSQAVTDFVLSQRDPAYAAAKQKMNDTPIPDKVQNPPEAETKMANGGVVADSSDKLDPIGDRIQNGIPSFGSTLPGLAEQMKHPTHEATQPAQDTLPTRSTQKFHQPFNTDMEDQLRAFLEAQKDKDDAESR